MKTKGKRLAEPHEVVELIDAWHAFVELFNATPESERWVCVRDGDQELNPAIDWPLELVDHVSSKERFELIRLADGRVFRLHYKGGWRPFHETVAQPIRGEHVRRVWAVDG